MTTLIEEPKAIEEIVARVLAAREALPDPDTEPNLAPVERDKLSDKRSQMLRLSSELRNRASTVAKLEDQFAEPRKLLAIFTEAREELCRRLEAVDPRSLPWQDQLSAQARLLDVKLGIQSLDRGRDGFGSGSALHEVLAGKGLVPIVGERDVLAGRGSIRLLEQRLADLEFELAEARARLDDALATAEKFLG